MLKVRDLMTVKVLSIGPDENLSTTFHKMSRLGVRHLPVVDKKGRLRGVITQRDLTHAALAISAETAPARRDEPFGPLTVLDFMTDEVHTIGPDADIAEAGRLLLEKKIGCLPVVARKHLVGIITESDFVRYLTSHAKAKNEKAA